nr:transposase [Bradyrhizobium sp. SZCCHNS3052]
MPGAKISAVARKHGIVTGLLFRWCAQFGIAQRKRAKFARALLPDDRPIAHTLRDLVRPPEGMMAIELADGRRVFCLPRQECIDSKGPVLRRYRALSVQLARPSPRRARRPAGRLPRCKTKLAVLMKDVVQFAFTCHPRRTMLPICSVQM